MEPITTQKPHQIDEVSANLQNSLPLYTQKAPYDKELSAICKDSVCKQELVYHRPESEVKAELEWLQNNPLEDIPF